MRRFGASRAAAAAKDACFKWFSGGGRLFGRCPVAAEFMYFGIRSSSSEGVLGGGASAGFFEDFSGSGRLDDIATEMF